MTSTNFVLFYKYNSMGGTTVRMAELLLQKGNAAEISASGASVSELFAASKPGGGNWIKSKCDVDFGRRRRTNKARHIKQA